jgi:DNA polymerase
VTTAKRSLQTLATEAAGCRRCHLWEHATQTVFGTGRPDARMVLVGEQPGDREDLEGRPFVGPAGRILDRALAAAGINRDEVYVTNAVKHFKFEQRGKRRIHQKPNRTEIVACHPWLEAELALLDPAIVVGLGATATEALLGPGSSVTRLRGQILPADPPTLVTIHPSAVLRVQTPEERESALDGMTSDLRAAGDWLAHNTRA